ncbi:MAG: YhcH/YjgK/YiaL family protein [Clostridia bacterium]
MNKNYLKTICLCKETQDDIQTCVDYIENNDISKLAPGKYPFEGKELSIHIAEYPTDVPEKRIWEAHAKFIDLHYIISGTEQIWVQDVSKMKVGELDVNRDFIPLEGEGFDKIAVMTPGDFCMCLPHEGHKTGVAIDGSVPIKKAIFKILVR